MKKAILLLLIMASAMALTITSHDIDITMRADGSGYVVEDFQVRLGEGERAEFELALEAGTPGDIGLVPTIVKEHSDINIIPQTTESDIAVVTFQYNVPEIVDTTETKGKQALVGLTEKAFSFYDGHTMQLPYDPQTTLSVMVPQDILLAGDPLPPTGAPTKELGVDGKQYLKYTWSYRKPFNTAEFRVIYEKEVSIQSQLSPSVILNEFREKYGNPIYIAVAVILLIVVLWYRKEVYIVVQEAFAGEPVIEDDEA